MIALQRVAKAYGNHALLRDVTFTLSPKQYIAVTGEPGSGKTAIVRLLLRAEDPTKGTVTVDGAPLAMLPAEFLQIYRRQVGAISQAVPLVDSWTVEKNVAYPLVIRGVQEAARRKRVTDVLKRLGMQETASLQADTLSDAHRQLAMLARAVVAQPAVLVADEPTMHLTEEQSRLAMAVLKEAHKRGTTVLLLTRDRSVANDAERVLQLKNGECVEAARHRAEASRHAHAQPLMGSAMQAKHAGHAKTTSAGRGSGRKVRITSIGSDL